MSKRILDVEVLWLAENGYPERTRLMEHSHPEYYQIYYIMDGRGVFSVNGEDVRFEPGTYFLLAPGVLHGIKQADPGAQGKVRVVEVKFTVFNQELSETLSRLPAVGQGTPELQNGYYQIFLEAIQKDFYYENRVPCLFTAWLYQLLRDRQRTGKTQGENGNGEKPAVQVKRYIDQHYAGEIPLDDLAEVIGYSKSYLCQIFREDTGMTINAYLNDVRITRALNLLMNPELSVAEVGQMCGYNSVYYFTKAFKKAIGVPPGSFRQAELAGGRYVDGPVESVNTVMRNSEVVMFLLNERGEYIRKQPERETDKAAGK